MSSRRQAFAGAAAVDRRLGHAVDDGGRFVLRQREAAGAAQLQQAVGAVVAHAR